MSAIQEFIKSELYEDARKELDAMQQRLNVFNGDKVRFQTTINVFELLLKSNASFRIDWVIQSHELDKLKVTNLLMRKELNNALQLNRKLIAMNEDGTRKLTNDELDSLAEIMKKKFDK